MGDLTTDTVHCPLPSATGVVMLTSALDAYSPPWGLCHLTVTPTSNVSITTPAAEDDGRIRRKSYKIGGMCDVKVLSI